MFKGEGQVALSDWAINRAGNLVDSMLSATRDMDSAQRFFRSAQSMIHGTPKQVTTDDHNSYPRAIRDALGPKVKHRCSAYMNHRIERDHRGVKQRYYPMLGFGALPSAQRFCRAFEELRQYIRPRPKQNELISLSNARRKFLFRALELQALFVATSLFKAEGRLHLSRDLSSDSLDPRC